MILKSEVIQGEVSAESVLNAFGKGKEAEQGPQKAAPVSVGVGAWVSLEDDEWEKETEGSCFFNGPAAIS